MPAIGAGLMKALECQSGSIAVMPGAAAHLGFSVEPYDGHVLAGIDVAAHVDVDGEFDSNCSSYSDSDGDSDGADGPGRQKGYSFDEARMYLQLRAILRPGHCFFNHSELPQGVWRTVLSCLLAFCVYIYIYI